MARVSTAYTDIDFERCGKQIGFVNIPHSPHDDAWGATRIPIGVIKNGDGPTAILQGGNHGDEYEGPITLGEILREVSSEDINGRIIILPAINRPAVEEGKRTSPIDDLNFNRTFPGNPTGTLTEQISAFVNDVIFPMGDAFIDLHSGGSSLAILPSAIIEPAPEPEHRRRNVEAVLAFDAPLTVVIDNLGDPRTASAASVRAGLTTVGTEMAGAGTVSLEALSICRRGVRNVLAHLGILPSTSVKEDRGGSILAIPGPDAYVLSPSHGVFEPFCPLGTWVSRGEQAGRVHHLTDPSRSPEPLFFQADGLLYGRRQPGLVRPGSCCLVVASQYQGELL